MLPTGLPSRAAVGLLVLQHLRFTPQTNVTSLGGLRQFKLSGRSNVSGTKVAGPLKDRESVGSCLPRGGVVDQALLRMPSRD